MYRYFYETPEEFSNIWMSSDGGYLTGLWFEGSKDCIKHSMDFEERDLTVFKDTAIWLDTYFSGIQPDFTPEYKIDKLTEFRKEVIDCMMGIPFGTTVTYGSIAEKIAVAHGISKMSARAVGGAVGWNPICIIIPCHRVVGSKNALTGYGGGLSNKIALLKHEKWSGFSF